MSRIGKAPIPVPSGVDVAISGAHISVKGPKGTLERDIPGVITVRQDGDNLVVERPDDERQNRAMHGLVVRWLMSIRAAGDWTPSFIRSTSVVPPPR
jgi:large subunit ribosomal protein L6